MTERDMSDATRINFMKSEIMTAPTVYQSATHIMAAYINNKTVTDANLKEMLLKSIKIALELALATEKQVNEFGSRKSGLS